MNKKYYENRWIWILFTCLFLLIVQILFSIPAPCKWLEAVWDAGDLVSLVGTLVLGYVAIKQNQQANNMSERLMDIEINRYKMEIRPFIMVTEWKAYELDTERLFIAPDKLYIQIGPYNDGENALGIGLQLQNTTDSYVAAEYLSGHSDKVTWTNAATNQPNRKLRLHAGESREIVFFANEDYMKTLEGEFITLEFILENRFAERYNETFGLIITALSNNCIHETGEWYCDSFVQDFKIGKYVKNCDGKIILKMEEETNG